MAIFHYKTVSNFIKCVIININYFRFIYCLNLWGNDVPTIHEAFGTYIHQKVDVNEETSCLAHITSLLHTSKKQQFMLLSTISNYHWYNLPSLKSSSTSAQRKSTHTGRLYSQHILHDPTCEMNDRRFLHLAVYPSVSTKPINISHI